MVLMVKSVRTWVYFKHRGNRICQWLQKITNEKLTRDDTHIFKFGFIITDLVAGGGSFKFLFCFQIGFCSIAQVGLRIPCVTLGQPQTHSHPASAFRTQRLSE